MQTLATRAEETSTPVLDHAADAAPAAFDALRGYQFMKLTSFRRSGAPVATTVWFAEDDGRLYVTTAVSSGKVKRLRHTPRVLVTPCTAWAAPRGPELTAVAHVLPSDRHAYALAALRHKYGWLYWIFERCNRTEQTYLEITPA